MSLLAISHTTRRFCSPLHESDLLPALQGRFQLRSLHDDYEGLPNDLHWLAALHEQAQWWDRTRAEVDRYEELAYFGWTWLPLALDLGVRVGATRKVRLFQRHHAELHWRWQAETGPPLPLVCEGLPAEVDPSWTGPVAIALSVSYAIDRSHVADAVKGAPQVHLRLAQQDTPTGRLDSFVAEDQLWAYVRAARDLLHRARDAWPNASEFHLMVAGPVGVGFGLGTLLNLNTLPPIVTYQHQNNQLPYYQRALRLGIPLKDLMKPLQLLFLASDPTGNLLLGQESREIIHEIQRSPHRNLIELTARTAVRAVDLQYELSSLQGHHAILHFSGHGTVDGHLITEDVRPVGQAAPQEIHGQRLIDALLALRSARPYALVVLNACWSYTIAEELVAQGAVPAAIGMSYAVKDANAIAFAAQLYQSIALGLELEVAFDLAKNQIAMIGGRQLDVPVLYAAPQARRSKLVLQG